MDLSKELSQIKQQFEEKRAAKDAQTALHRTMQAKTYTQKCEECGVDYHPKRFWQRFCSDDCRFSHHKFALKRQSEKLLDQHELLLEERDRLLAEIERLKG